EVIVDQNIGIMWQRNLPEIIPGCSMGEMGETCKKDEAVSYCETLVYSGYDDWRLPTIEELETIIDYGKSEPCYDQALFVDNQNGLGTSLWSGSFYLEETYTYHFFLSPFGNVYSEIIDSGEFDPSARVRCVRGNIYAPVPSFSEETVGEDELVKDARTGLWWMKNFYTYSEWMMGMSNCEASEAGGHTDWRMPNINELKTLLDRSLKNPPSSFPGMGSTGFIYSSTTDNYVEGNGSVWFVDKQYGSSYSNSKIEYMNVEIKCVRGPL
ncbi:MAG TPA: DUF1566 domain-containing protein, partial [bacterium]|nr:DUF1566 domain-containing protein [bacterium]